MRILPVVGTVAGLAMIAAGATLVLGRSAPTQPIAFSHRVHVQELEMSCGDCHLYAESAARATIPNVPVCADCHEEPSTGSPDEALLLSSIQQDEPIRWFRVTVMPDDVYFSHRRHIVLGELACEQCHGEVGSRERPLTRPLIRMTMDDCIDCHERQEVTSDCIACHR